MNIVNLDDRAVTLRAQSSPREAMAHSRVILAVLVTVGLWGGVGSVKADVPNAFQQFGRAIGAGWGDGYHACKCSGCRPLADLPPHPYHSRSGDVSGCNSSACDHAQGCQSDRRRCGGQVNETGLTLRANPGTSLRHHKWCLEIERRLGISRHVCETGLAIKAPAAAVPAGVGCDLASEPHAAGCSSEPARDTQTHDHSPSELGQTPATMIPLGDPDRARGPRLAAPSPISSPQPAGPSSIAENFGKTVMHPGLSAPQSQPVRLGDPVRVLAPERHVGVTELPSPQPQHEATRPVRIAQGDLKPKLSADSELADLHFHAEIARDTLRLNQPQQARPSGEKRTPKRLPTVH